MGGRLLRRSGRSRHADDPVLRVAVWRPRDRPLCGRTVVWANPAAQGPGSLPQRRSDCCSTVLAAQTPFRLRCCAWLALLGALFVAEPGGGAGLAEGAAGAVA